MGAIVVIFVSFGKVQSVNFFDKINFENFLLIKLYIQNIKNWERASKIQELFKPLLTTWFMNDTKRKAIHVLVVPCNLDESQYV